MQAFSMPGVSSLRILRQESNCVSHPEVQLWSVALLTGALEHPGELSLKMPNKFPSSHPPQLFYSLVNGEKRIQFQGLSLTIGYCVCPELPLACGSNSNSGEERNGCNFLSCCVSNMRKQRGETWTEGKGGQ